MAKKKKLAEAPLTEYEKVRARNMMRNNRIFVSLSISGISAIIRRGNGGQEGSSITNDDSTSAITQGESSAYNPNEDEAIAEEEVDDSVVETGIKVPKACRRKRGAIKKISKKANNSEASSTMAPVWVLAVPPGRSERLFDIAEADPTPRVTGQKVKDKAISTKDGSPLEKNVGSLPQQNVESSLHLIVESSPHMDVGYGSMDEGSTVRMDLSPIAPTVARQPLDCDVFAEEPEHPTSDEGTSIVLGRKRKGSGLEKITIGLGCKVRIEIALGMKHPEKPVQAAKFASEGGMIARGHTPILPHFKEYKKDKNLIKDFIGKVAGNLELDTEDQLIKDACTDMLKNVSKNRHHFLKKKFFDTVNASEFSVKSPVIYVSDAQWKRLVNLWTRPQHKVTCTKNKINRGKVKFPQKTGSRCYVAHIYATQEECKVADLSAIEMFKATQNSTKKGFSVEALDSIAEMEAEMAKTVPEGETPKSATEIIAQVLTMDNRSNTFLKNVGLQSGSKNKFNKTNAEVSAHVIELEDRLEKSQQETVEMRAELAAMKKKKAAEAEAAQAQRDKEYQLLLKRTEESNARVQHMMAMFGGNSSGK